MFFFETMQGGPRGPDAYDSSKIGANSYSHEVGRLSSSHGRYDILSYTSYSSRHYDIRVRIYVYCVYTIYCILQCYDLLRPGPKTSYISGRRLIVPRTVLSDHSLKNRLVRERSSQTVPKWSFIQPIW